VNILYTIIIFPLVQIMELCYLFVHRVFRNPGVSICGISMAVSVFTLPLYLRAEKWQETERQIQKRMAPKIAKIKSVFSGDEQYMILSAYYRQNHYHPVYAMRNTFSLLIQIPFFMAAYFYLSRLKALQGVSFLFIRDLGIPDALLSVGGGGVPINILPVVMTIINCTSGAVYTRGLAVKDKIQLYGTAVIFLILLYNSPSGLVLYWTLNNIFSLAKNIAMKTKYAGRLIYGILTAGIIFVDIYILFFHSGYLPKRILISTLFSALLFIPPLKKITMCALHRFEKNIAIVNAADTHRFFSLSLLIFVLLAGLVIPGSLVSSSVAEFSFIAPYASPFPFIFHTLLQAVGVFLFWPICIYLLSSYKARTILSACVIALSFGALFNVFLVNENFGFLTNALIFSEPKSFAAGNPAAYLTNTGILIASTAVIVYLLLQKKTMLLFAFQVIALVSLLGFGILNVIRIHGEYPVLQNHREQGEDTTETSCYTLSRSGKNVVLIMLDAAVADHIPRISEERPELFANFHDFTWYPNCVSFSNHTLVGAPPLYGGYEYTPDEINRRDSVPLVEKHKEAYLLLPRLFSELGYSVTVTDPPFDNFRASNLDIFTDSPRIRAMNVIGKYTPLWRKDHPDIQGQIIDVVSLLQNNLIRFSVFKLVPLLFRSFMYDDGNWLTTNDFHNTNSPKDGLTNTFIDDYAFMDLLPRLTKIADTGDTYTAIYAPLPHEPVLLQYPAYIPSGNVTIDQDRPFAADAGYHVNIASFLLLEKFFHFLKGAGVYNNTRIILVSDHGRVIDKDENKIVLPDGSYLQSYHPLLMVKDFQPENGHTGNRMAIDDSFMTNADTVFFALEKIIENPVNPFTNNPLLNGKNAGVNIVTIGALSSYRHTKYKYNIGRRQWLRVRDNIFDLRNWEMIEK
jgi:YidC/Oxa1 family membrane protein insertase